MDAPDDTAAACAVVDVQHGGSPFAFEVALHQQLPRAEAMHQRAQASGLETAFLAPKQASSGAHFQLRWFSPHGEMQLCGAGTLAAALFLFRGPADPAQDVTFSTAAGTLRGRSEGRGRVAIRLPRYPLRPCDPDPALLSSLGLAAPAPPALVSEAAQTVVLPLPARSHVAGLRPDFAALAAVRAPHLGAMIVTAPGGLDADLVFRYFTPWHGKDESAVAGSALSTLAPYWADRLGQPALRARQLSPQGASFAAQVEPDGVWLDGRGAVRGAASS